VDGSEGIKNNLGKKEENLPQSEKARVVKIQIGKSLVPVYDLTIEKHHCYLANGILVSNSDAFRGLAVAYEEIVTKSFKNTVVNNIQDDPYGR